MTDVLTRLLRALAKNPLLEYLVWKRMRNLRFHGPWEPDGEGRFVLVTEDGIEVAEVERDENCWGWAIADGGGGETWTEAEAREKVEAELQAGGWRFVPEGEWIPSLRLRTFRNGIGPWSHDVGTGTYARHYTSGASAVSVGWASGQSAVEWATWTDGAHSQARILAEGREVSVEWAKYRADQVLLSLSLITRAQACLEPPEEF